MITHLHPVSKTKLLYGLIHVAQWLQIYYLLEHF